MNSPLGRGGVLGVGTLWFITSALLSTYANMSFLRYFGSPLFHTLIRFSGAAFLGAVSGHLPWRRLPDVVPLLWLPAVLLLAANCLNSLSLQLSGITICYTIKSGIPMFTCIGCLMRGERFTLLTYATLIPTVVGVALASASDDDVTAGGILAALGSAIAQTALNFYSKARTTQAKLEGIQALSVTSLLCTVMALPFNLYDFLIEDQSNAESVYLRILDHIIDAGDFWPLFLAVLAAFAYFTEYSLDFTFVVLVPSLLFSVADIARRLAIIIAGAFLFDKHLSLLNCVGVGLALSGVLAFCVFGEKKSTDHRS